MIADLATFLWTQVWPNVVASIICGSAVWLWARRHLYRIHRQHEELRAAIAHLHDTTQARAADTNRLVRTMSDRLGIDPDTGEDRLPPPRYPKPS